MLPRLFRRGLASAAAPTVSRRQLLRQKARSRLAAAAQGSGGSATWLAMGGTCGVVGTFVAYVAAERDLAKGIFAPLSDLRTWLRVNVLAMAKPLLEPPREALLAPWPLPGVPPGMPPPPTLVLDLEGTLVKPEWSRKHGWRYAKRPGFDAFIKEMSKYYEIVVFSSAQMFSVAPFLEKEMAKGQISHVLFRTDMKWRSGHLVKPIDYINRPRDRIICLDHEPRMLELNPEHALFVPVFDDLEKADDTLERLIPLFVALVTEEVRSYPRLLEELGTHDALEAAEIHRRRVLGRFQQVEEKKRRGLGGLIHRAAPTPELAVPDDNPFSAKAIAAADAAKNDAGGVAPPPVEGKAKGGLWQMLDRRSKDQEERAQRTMERFNDMMMKEAAEKKAGNDGA